MNGNRKSKAFQEVEAIQQAKQIIILALSSVDQASPNHKLAVKPEITDPTQIKTFCVVKGSSSEYSTGLRLSKYAIDPASVKIVYSGPPELPAFLMRGDTDGYFVWEPLPGLGIRRGLRGGSRCVRRRPGNPPAIVARSCGWE